MQGAQGTETPTDDGKDSHRGERQFPRYPENGEPCGHEEVESLEEEEELPSVVTVGQGTCGKAEHQIRDRVEEADQTEGRRRAAEEQHDVTERRRLDPAPDKRAHHSDRVEAEGTVS